VPASVELLYNDSKLSLEMLLKRRRRRQEIQIADAAVEHGSQDTLSNCAACMKILLNELPCVLQDASFGAHWYNSSYS
jgi:hypothetical protein